MGEPPERPVRAGSAAPQPGGPTGADQGDVAAPSGNGGAGDQGGKAALSADDGALLCRIAVAAIGARLAGMPLDAPIPDRGPLTAPGASFVTLRTRGLLRGCLGTLRPDRPLYQDVIRNARRAMLDPRLPPVTAGDWPVLDVAVSVLSPPDPMPAACRADLVARLRPGVDGLILDDGRHRRVTFLPSVWSKLPDADRFVSALLAKGGWSPTEWPDGLAAWRYLTVEYVDPAPRGPLDKAG